MRQPDLGARRGVNAGFTLIELLVVVGVIAVAGALALPNIAGYIRNYRIRAATQQVAGEIQAARHRAISKNVNLGVVFVTRDATSYQWAVEDDQTTRGPSATYPVVNATFLDDRAQASPRFTLPQGVEFSTTCPSPPSGGAWDTGLRFNRLGAWCDPTGSSSICPALDSGSGQTFVYNNASGSLICVRETRTGLTRSLTVLTGGRVAADQQ